MIVSQLWTYPFKSAKGISLSSVKLDSEGLCGDRRLMAVDKNGLFITARRYPQLLQLSCIENTSGWLLQHPLLDNTCQINRHDLSILLVGTLWKDSINALDGGDKVAGWFSNLLKIDIRIAVWQAKSRYSNKYQIQTSFSDASPILIASKASVQQACLWGDVAPDARRFRPNILLDGVGAFEEDQWYKFCIGDVEFEVLDTCTRCILTTRDPDTGETNPNKQPLAALKERHTNKNNQPLLGINVKLSNPNMYGKTISVGDKVYLCKGLV